MQRYPMPIENSRKQRLPGHSHKPLRVAGAGCDVQMKHLQTGVKPWLV